MMIVALMYGFRPRPTIDILRMSPPEKSDKQSEDAVVGACGIQ